MNFSKKHLKTVFFAAVSIFAMLAVSVFAQQSQSSNGYVYEIFKDGQVVKALNVQTGNIDYTGDARTVIEKASSFGKILIKAGTYQTYNINLPSNAWLVGEGTQTILQTPPNVQENIISTFNKDNVRITNITFDGNRLNNARQSNTARQNGIYFSGSTNITIENSYVYRTVESGIQITGRDGTLSSDIKILNNTVDDTWGEGIVVFDGVSNVTVQGNTSSRNGELANGGYSGITIMRNIKDAAITGNTVYSNTIDGIAIDGDPGFENKNITVQNNVSYDNRMSGIALHDTINSNILNNDCYDNKLAGIWIADNSHSNVINDNKCYNNVEYGIREYIDCKFNAFNRNNVYSNKMNQMLEGFLHNIDDKCAPWAMINQPNYTIQNNTWGASVPETECIYQTDSGKIGWYWIRPNGGMQITYPNVNIGIDRGIPSWPVFPKKVSEFASCSFTMTYSYPQLPTGVYNLAPEMYFREGITYLSSPKAEVMFYLDHSSTNPATEFGLGAYLGDVNDGNLGYKLYYRTWDQGWRLFTFVRNGIGNTTSGPHTYTVNIKYILDYLATHDLLNTGTKMIDQSWYALGVEFGNEVYNGAGKMEISELDINVNGNILSIPSTPTPTSSPTPIPTPSPTVSPTPTPIAICQAMDICPTPIPPPINFTPTGRFERADSTHVTGWAYDQNAGVNPINVHIYIDGVPTANITANLPRPDLVKSKKIPDPNHGFDYQLPADLSIGKHIIDIYAINIPEGKNPKLPGSPKRINTINYLPTGRFESADSIHATGWAYDKNAGVNPINVHIYIDGVPTANITANLPMPDLVKSKKIPDPNHGFDYQLPADLSIGKHIIDIYAINIPEGKNRRLPGSPKRINKINNPIPTPINHDPIGNLDGADAIHTTGWAYDQDNGTNPINVHIYIDGNPIANVLANLPRPDLVSSGITPDPFHGFDYAFVGLSAGTHTVDVYAINVPAGNNPKLAGSPKTITVNIPSPTPSPTPTPSPSLSPSLSPTPSPTPTPITNYSYLIYKEGDNTIAKNGGTGNIDFINTDSGQVIQSAIDNSNGIVHIKPGLYVGNFLKGKTGLTLEGEGKDTIYQLAPNSNSTTFDIGGNNSTIKDMAFDGNKLNQSQPGQVINAYGLTDIKIDNVTAKNSKTWDGINIDSCSNVQIVRSEIYGADGFGIRIKSGSNALIDGNTAHDNARINIDFDTTSDSKITNNITYNSGEDGIALDFNSTKNTISNNTVYSNSHFGIATDTVHAPHYAANTIENNEVYDNGWDGIIVIRGNENIITGNTVHNNGKEQASKFSEIKIEGLVESPGVVTKGESNSNNVNNNTIKNSSGRGITIQGNSSGNKIDNCNIDNVKQEGIMIAKRGSEISQHNTVTNCMIINTGNHGIVSTGADYTNISNNRVENAGINFTSGFAHGIAVDGNGGLDPNTGCIVSGNTVINSYDAGIEIADQANDCTVSNNTVDTTKNGYGIYYGGGLALSSGGKITGNTVKGSKTNGIEIGSPNYNSSSKNIAITENTSYSNALDGIYVNGADITLQTNITYNNVKSGIALYGAISSNIIGNTSYNNDYGIREYSNSKFNTFSNNITYFNRIANQLLEGQY